MAVYQNHHICYDPAWIVELTAQMHKCITTIQITKATEDHYARLTNFLHAITSEWNRMRMELDSNLDLRTRKPK